MGNSLNLDSQEATGPVGGPTRCLTFRRESDGKITWKNTAEEERERQRQVTIKLAADPPMQTRKPTMKSSLSCRRKSQLVPGPRVADYKYSVSCLICRACEQFRHERIDGRTRVVLLLLIPWLSKMGKSKSLVFAVNGQRFELSDIDPSTTVLEFLRLRTRFKSVKLGCGEGSSFN